MDEKHKIAWVAAYHGQLTREFNDSEYGKCMFFPDDVTVRQAKFMLWLMKKYGVEDQFLNDIEKFEMFVMLKRD
jgi:hypothetical protein